MFGQLRQGVAAYVEREERCRSLALMTSFAFEDVRAVWDEARRFGHDGDEIARAIATASARSLPVTDSLRLLHLWATGDLP